MAMAGLESGESHSIQACGGVERSDEWDDVEEEETVGGYKRFFFERCLDSVDTEGATPGRREENRRRQSRESDFERREVGRENRFSRY